MKTLTKKTVKTVLENIIKNEDKEATNLRIKEILKDNGYYVTQGMVAGFTNQIYTENKGRYKKSYNGSFVTYSFNEKLYNCFDVKDSERRTSQILAHTPGRAKSLFKHSRGSNCSFINIRAKRGN